MKLLSDTLEFVKEENGWSCSADPGEPGYDSKLKRWSVGGTEARLLSELFRGLTVLEIGTGLGVSTRGIATTAVLVHTIDIDPWVKKHVAPDLPENVVFHDSREFIPKVDATFIDGLHTYEQCCLDMEFAKEKTKPGGLIVLHDFNGKEIQDAIGEANLFGFQIVTGAGMALLWNDEIRRDNG